MMDEVNKKQQTKNATELATDLQDAKMELMEAKNRYHKVVERAILSLGEMPVAEAMDAGLIKLGFSTEGIPRRSIVDMLTSSIRRV